MANDDLVSIREGMGNAASDVWNTENEDIQDAIDQLRDVFGEDARNAFVDAARSSGSLRDNMRDAAEEHGVKQEFLNLWSSGKLRELQYAIKNKYQNEWAGQTEAADAIYSAFKDADIGKLNTMCADGDYGEVMDELGNPDNFSRPGTFAECAQVVARVQKIGNELESMYREA